MSSGPPRLRQPRRNVPAPPDKPGAVGITNGDVFELAYEIAENYVEFAQASPDLIGPGAIDPQDAAKLLGQVSPVPAFIYGDIENGEYDRYLQGNDGKVVYHEMLSDGTVINSLNYLWGALRCANWTIEPASADPVDLEIAAFVAEQLGIDDMSPNKYAFSRLFTLYEQGLIYGQSYGEIVLAPGPDGKAVLDKIININPFAIEEIEFDNMGGPKTIVVSGTARGTGKPISRKKLPISKCVAFTHRDDGTFTGRSILRAAVAHWRVKRSMVVLINQGMERYLLGVPIIRVPRNVRPGTKQWEAAQIIARNFVSKPRTGIILPPGWEFEVAKLNVNMPDAKPYLEYHDAALARAIGIDFNTIRQTDTMQNFDVNSFIDLTDNTIETLAKEFASTVNLYLIPKLAVLNWPQARLLPRLVYNINANEDFSASANLMGMLLNSAMSASTQTGPATVGADGTKTPGATTTDVTQAIAMFREMMGALPGRFKRALGIDELELQERLAQYRSGASTGYRRDNRKPLPGGK